MFEKQTSYFKTGNLDTLGSNRRLAHAVLSCRGPKSHACFAVAIVVVAFPSVRPSVRSSPPNPRFPATPAPETPNGRPRLQTPATPPSAGGRPLPPPRPDGQSWFTDPYLAPSSVASRCRESADVRKSTSLKNLLDLNKI